MCTDPSPPPKTSRGSSSHWKYICSASFVFIHVFSFYVRTWSSFALTFHIILSEYIQFLRAQYEICSMHKHTQKHTVPILYKHSLASLLHTNVEQTHTNKIGKSWIYIENQLALNRTLELHANYSNRIFFLFIVCFIVFPIDFAIYTNRK